MPVDERLSTLADTLLDNLAVELEMEGLDVPSRRYVQAGDVAHDFAGQNCAEAFVITWNGSFQGVVGAGTGNLTNRPIVCSMPLVAQFTIALLRCVPVVRERNGRIVVPTAEELDANGKQILVDAMTMAKVLVDKNTDLLPSEFYQIGISSLQPIGPLGGVGGTALTVVVGMV